MKDSKNLLLGLLSAGLVITWVYHFYDKSYYTGQTHEVFIKDSTAVAEAVSDSLRRYYSKTLNALSTEKLEIDSTNDLLKGELGQRIREINKLRSEIGDILKRKNLTESDLFEAKTKIEDLEKRIDDLKSENTSLADERQQLNGILNQLNGEMNSLQQNIQKVSAENKLLTQKINDASVFIASELRFAAYNVRSDQKEVETNQQKKADKFVISFIVQNNVTDFDNAEIVVVITDPSGKSLLAEVWDTGSFDTKTEGRKIFTRKIKFEYIKGEAKKLIFSLEPGKFIKGNYNLGLYHKGVRIGTANWNLN